MNRRGRFVLIAGVLGAVLTLHAAAGVRIVPIVRDDQVTVSIELTDAYNDEIKEAIASGLRTTFTYDVELRMVVPAWVDRTVATAVISASDQYDNLSRRHHLTRAVDGRTTDTLVTEDEAAVARWLTAITRVPICPTNRLDPSRDYYLRINARARPNGSSILGFTNAVSGSARFSFLP
jgi:hypothetical protein